jgi:hypothetical protein
MAHTTGSHPYLAHKEDTIDTSIAPGSFASCDPYIQLQFNEKRCQLSRHKNTDSVDLCLSTTVLACGMTC